MAEAFGSNPIQCVFESRHLDSNGAIASASIEIEALGPKLVSTVCKPARRDTPEQRSNRCRSTTAAARAVNPRRSVRVLAHPCGSTILDANRV